MPTYGPVIVDIDLNLGRQYGYRNPANIPPRPWRGGRPAKCHPDRAVHAHNLCGACYRREWKKARR